MIEKDQVAVVTGAAQGIGAAIALALAKRGVRVMCLDVKAEENRAVAAVLQQVCPGHEAYHCDVSDPQQVSRVLMKFWRRPAGLIFSSTMPPCFPPCLL